VDIIVNAVGISQAQNIITQNDDEIVDIVGTNLLSTIWMCKRGSKLMLKSNGDSE
jgi:NAD(P)-dependent dehydrogenase (short-subunit alcohol dehydrogenase family)